MKIVVVGAGVIGLACAYELLQDNHEVVVLDSGLAGQAASHGNAAKVAIGEAGPVPAPGMIVQGLKWMLRADSPLYVKPSPAPSFVWFMLQLARNCTEKCLVGRPGPQARRQDPPAVRQGLQHRLRPGARHAAHLADLR